MAKAKRKKRQQRERLHKEPVVRRVAELLLTGTPTAWRFTSAARHGLRAGYCLKGLSWSDADKQAAAIVVLARHRIGLSHFPSWSVAQGTPVETVHRWCAVCQGYSPEGHSSLWCSEQCRVAFHNRRYDFYRRRDDAARQEAIRAAMGADPTPSRAERSCRGCGKLYLSKEPQQRFCSQPCGVKAVRMTRRAEPRACAICSTTFTPCAASALYCGPACVAEATRRSHRARRARRREAAGAKAFVLSA